MRRFMLRMALAVLGSFSPAARARNVMGILGIPVTAFGRDKAQLVRMGRNLKRARFPSRAAIRTDLGIVRSAPIPTLVISGGWSEAFMETGQIVATAAGGDHVITPSENHFPQWKGDTFNPVLTDFWRSAEASQMILAEG